MYTSVNAVTQACMSFTSQNYGAGQWKRMGKVLRHCLFLTTAVSLMLGSVIYSFGPEILKLYTEEPDVIASAMEVLSYTTLTYFMCGIMDLFPGALRGMGFSAAPMVLSIIGTVGTRLVWIYGIFPMIKFYLPVMCCLTCVSAEFLKELRSKCGTVCKKLKHYLMMWLFMPDTNIRRGRCVWQWRAGKRRQWKNIWRWLTRG